MHEDMKTTTRNVTTASVAHHITGPMDRFRIVSLIIALSGLTAVWATLEKKLGIFYWKHTKEQGHLLLDPLQLHIGEQVLSSVTSRGKCRLTNAVFRYLNAHLYNAFKAIISDTLAQIKKTWPGKATLKMDSVFLSTYTHM